MEVILSLRLSQFLLQMFNELKDTIPHINSEANPSPPLSMLFASIWDSFTAQALVLRFFKYATELSKGEGPYLFLESGPFENFRNFFQKLTWSQ